MFICLFHTETMFTLLPVKFSIVPIVQFQVCHRNHILHLLATRALRKIEASDTFLKQDPF